MNDIDRTSQARPRRGFTLLEVVLSLALLALLIGMVMGIATQNIGLGRAVVEKQNDVGKQEAFFQFLSHQFASLPGNARIELVSKDSGSRYMSDLTIQNVPLTFMWGGVERVAKAVRISTVQRRGNTVNIVMSYYENEILDGTTTDGEPLRPGDMEPFAQVVLLEDVFVFEWEVLDGRTMEWLYDWDLAGRLPLQLRLSFVPHPGMNVQTDTIRHIFWITPKQDPAVAMRQLEQDARSGAIGEGALRQPGGGRPGAGGTTGEENGGAPPMTMPGGRGGRGGMPGGGRVPGGDRAGGGGLPHIQR